jgi:hypothetical protein
MPTLRIASLVIPAACILAVPKLAAQALPQAAAVQPIPAEMTGHYNRLHPRLQPSAASWVQSEARAELERPEPDVAGLQSAVRGRFGSSKLPAADVDAMAFLVLMTAVNSTDNDLKAQMAGVKTLNAAKDSLRKLMEQVNQDVANAAATSSGATCQSPSCASLAGQIKNVARQTQNVSFASKMTKGVGTVVKSTASNTSTVSGELWNATALASTGPLTFAHLHQIQTQLGSSLKGLDDLSETQSLQLQMLMDRRSKLLSALSNIMKSAANANAATIANLK